MTKNTFYIVFICLFAIQSHGQSKIQKAENSLEKSNTSRSINNAEDDNDDDESEYNFLNEVIASIFIDVFAHTIYGLAIESPFEYNSNSHNAYITKHPYSSLKKGNYTYTFDEDASLFRVDLAGRYISENERIKGAHINLDLRFLKRIGFEANFLQLWENNPNFGHDHLALYTAMVKYYRIRTQKIDAWWGLGLSHIDGALDDTGFTYGLGAEFFFVKPLSFEANFNQTLINNETVNKFSGLFNYHFNEYKMIVGYEHLKIGNQNFPTISLGAAVFL